MTSQRTGAHAEAGESRGYTLRLFLITTLASVLTVAVVALVDVAIGGVHQ